MLLTICILAVLGLGEPPAPTTMPAEVRVYFSPGPEAEQAVIAELRAAKTSLTIAAYRLTAAPIAKEVVEAHRRGVKVSIILDRAQQRDAYTDATFFANAGIAVLIDHEHPIHHNKVMVIDGRVVITGSYNFTAAATRNAENLLVIESDLLAQRYAADLAGHAGHSRPYIPPTK